MIPMLVEVKRVVQRHQQMRSMKFLSLGSYFYNLNRIAKSEG